MLHFNLSNNNNQYRLIFQSPPYQRLTSPIVHTEFALCRTYPGLICEYQDPNKGETKYHTFLTLLLFGCFMLFIRFICFCMCYRHTYIHLWIRWVIIWKLINLMAHIYSGSRLCPGLALEYRLLLLWTYHYVPHTTLQISGYWFRGLIITRPTRHFRNITIINMTSYQFPSVSPTPV